MSNHSGWRAIGAELNATLPMGKRVFWSANTSVMQIKLRNLHFLFLVLRPLISHLRVHVGYDLEYAW